VAGALLDGANRVRPPATCPTSLQLKFGLPLSTLHKLEPHYPVRQGREPHAH
jgi:hypothetical protein